MIKTISKISDFLSKIGVFLASIVLIMLVLLILTEIVGRSFFHYSTMLADEYSAYFYLALSYLGFAYTFNQKGHIRINFLTSRLSKNTRRILDILVGLTASATLTFALYYSWLSMLDAKELEMVSENVSETPIYLTQIPITIGLSLFLLSSIAFTLRKIADDI